MKALFMTNLLANCRSRVGPSTLFNLRQNWYRSLQAVFLSPKDKARFKKVSKFSCVLITRFLAVLCLFHGAI